MDRETLEQRVSTGMRHCMNKVIELSEAPFAVANGFELKSLDENTVRLTKKIRPEDLNSNGVVHGGAIYSVMDHTFAFSCNMEDELFVGQSCEIKYYRPCKGPVIETESKIVNRSHSFAITEIRAYCEGKLIASMMCTGFKVEKIKK